MSHHPDEDLARDLDTAERELVTDQHKWFAWATVLAALATGITLLLPWTLSRRLGQSVWQLGIDTAPALALTWIVGLLGSIAALVFRPGAKAQAATAVTGIIAMICAAGAWQANTLDPATDGRPGPGPSFTLVAGICWLLCATAQLIADRPRHTPPDDDAIARAVTRLRQSPEAHSPRASWQSPGGGMGSTRGTEVPD
jgi:hypothetical protein